MTGLIIAIIVTVVLFAVSCAGQAYSRKRYGVIFQVLDGWMEFLVVATVLFIYYAIKKAFLIDDSMIWPELISIVAALVIVLIIHIAVNGICNALWPKDEAAITTVRPPEWLLFGLDMFAMIGCLGIASISLCIIIFDKSNLNLLETVLTILAVAFFIFGVFYNAWRLIRRVKISRKKANNS